MPTMVYRYTYIPIGTQEVLGCPKRPRCLWIQRMCTEANGVPQMTVCLLLLTKGHVDAPRPMVHTNDHSNAHEQSSTGFHKEKWTPTKSSETYRCT